MPPLSLTHTHTHQDGQHGRVCAKPNGRLWPIAQRTHSSRSLMTRDGCWPKLGSLGRSFGTLGRKHSRSAHTTHSHPQEYARTSSAPAPLCVLGHSVLEARVPRALAGVRQHPHAAPCCPATQPCTPAHLSTLLATARRAEGSRPPAALLGCLPPDLTHAPPTPHHHHHYPLGTSLPFSAASSNKTSSIRSRSAAGPTYRRRRPSRGEPRSGAALLPLP